MTTYRLGPTSATAITLYPEWDFAGDLRKVEKIHRLENGELFVYKMSDYKMIDFSVKYLTVSDASVINGWWLDNEKLQFFQDSSVSSVMIRNKKKPFSKYIKPYNDLMLGQIKLEGY